MTTTSKPAPDPLVLTMRPEAADCAYPDGEPHDHALCEAGNDTGATLHPRSRACPACLAANPDQFREFPTVCPHVGIEDTPVLVDYDVTVTLSNKRLGEIRSHSLTLPAVDADAAELAGDQIGLAIVEATAGQWKLARTGTTVKPAAPAPATPDAAIVAAFVHLGFPYTVDEADDDGHYTVHRAEDREQVAQFTASPLSTVDELVARAKVEIP